MKKLVDFIKKNYLLIIFSVCILIFVLVLEDVFESEIMKVDTICYNIFVEYLRSDVLTTIMKIITNLGSGLVLISITILFIAFYKNKKEAVLVPINLGIVTFLNLVFKNLIERTRPDGYRLVDVTGFSFPSGHSMISTAFYGLLIYFCFKYIKNKYIKYFICSVLLILIILIGISRIYLGVHYASDVIAGAVLSVAYLIIFIKISNNLLAKR